MHDFTHVSRIAEAAAESKEWWDEEDSDFEPDGDGDSESDYLPEDDEEDCKLCNTMLVTGPHGVGKTAMVYALAQELGYKVKTL